MLTQMLLQDVDAGLGVMKDGRGQRRVGRPYGEDLYEIIEAASAA